MPERTLSDILAAARGNQTRRDELARTREENEGIDPYYDLSDYDESMADAERDATELLDALVALLGESGIETPWVHSDERASVRDDDDDDYNLAKTQYLDKIEDVIHYTGGPDHD